MTKLFSIFLISAFVFLFSLGKAFAGVSCQPVYGGGQTCITTGNLIINKMVQNPQTGQFVDNLSINDPKFSPNQSVTFQISLTNTGGTTIQQANIRDIFPGFVGFTSGPGNFDQNSKTLSFVTDNLNPSETRNFTLVGKVFDTNQLPANQAITCVVNQATATTNNGQMNQDNVQFCIEKGVTTKGGFPVFPPPKVVTTPPTGPELIPLVGLLPAGISGWFLRKKSQVFAGKK